MSINKIITKKVIRSWLVLAGLIIMMLGLFGTGHETMAAPAPMPTNPNATQKTKDIYTYLFNLRYSSANKVVGQYIGFSPNINTAYLSDVYRATGKWPAIVHVDYENGWAPYSEVGGVDYTNPNAVAIDQWKHGGLVQVGWHPHNPLNNASFNSELMSSTDFNNLVVPGTSQYILWHQKLDQVAEGLKQLADAGVTVMFRPLHEMNSGWQWWSQGWAYKNVYIDMYNYFTTTKGLNNILWIYCPADYSDFSYPGDSYVDIVAYDDYIGTQSSYDLANSLHGADKVLAVAEQGGAVNPFTQNLTNIAFWSDWGNNIAGTDSNFSAVHGYLSLKSTNAIATMNDSRSIDRSGLGGIGGSGAIGNSFSSSFENVNAGTAPPDWMDGAIGGIGTWEVVLDGANKVYKPQSVTAKATSSLDVCMDTVDFQADFKTTSHNSTGGVWLAGRWNATCSNIAGGYNYQTGCWEIRENSGSSSLLRASAAGTVSDGTTYTLRLVANGYQVDFYVNGVLTLTTSGVTKYWPGEVALIADNCDTGFDNVNVTGSFDISADLALLRGVTARSTYRDGMTHEILLTDGSISNSVVGYKSASLNYDPNANEWVEVDLGSNKVFNQVKLFPRTYLGNVSGTGNANFPVDFTIQVKPEGGSYSVVKTVVGQNNPAGQAQVYDFGLQNARYVKVNVTKLGDPASNEPTVYRLALAEMEVYHMISSDTTAPSAITNLSAGVPTSSTVTLNWTSPGDDGSSGTAAGYDIRYSTSPVTEANWASATQASGEPVPVVEGTNQSFTVTGLLPNTTYYFAIKTYDEVPNISAISNVPSGTTEGYTNIDWNFNTDANLEGWTMANASVTVSGGAMHLTANGIDPLIWSPNDLAIAAPSVYNRVSIRMQNNSPKTSAKVFFITNSDQNWNEAKSKAFTITANSGYIDYVVDMSTVTGWTDTIKQFRVDPLDPAVSGQTVDIDYIRLTDEGTSDATAPSAITNLSAGVPTSSTVTLNWTSPGDDGSSGTAAGYDIRYSTLPITEVNWVSATQASGEPVPVVAGTNQSFTVTGLLPNTTYYFAIKTSDEVPNISGISNVPSGVTGGYTSIKDWNFNTNDNLEGWINANAIVTVSGGSLHLTAGGIDPLLLSPNDLTITAPATYNKVRIRMQNNSPKTTAKIYFITNSDQNWNEAKAKAFTITANSGYTDYVVDMSAVSGWTGTIKQIRVDPLDQAVSGQTADIDYIRLTN